MEGINKAGLRCGCDGTLIWSCALNTMIGNGWLQYVVVLTITIAGTVVFSVVVKELLEIVEKGICKKLQQVQNRQT